MIPVPNMIMIGAASRNVGKTEFACALVAECAKTTPVYAVKVTPVDASHGPCPRGGQGCGVCSSLSGDYCLTEETLDPSGAKSGKDTERMLLAGATKVYWLRVLRTRMEEGVRELLSRLPEGACVVCESNTARTVIEPGAFVVISAADAEPRPAMKESCEKVIADADRVIAFRGDGWDMGPEACTFSDGFWRVRLDASVIVLSGGKSSRMGEDKSLLPVAGRTMIEHIVSRLEPWTDEIVIGANDPEAYAFTGLRVVPDEERDCGPLMGIASCLDKVKHERAFVSACDIPEFSTGFLRTMMRLARSADIVIPLDPQGRPEPLMAAYSKRALPAMRALLSRGERRIVSITTPQALEEFGLTVRFEPFPGETWPENINTKEDYKRMKTRRS